ncbi:hypothetical protein [Streptomyces canarius]
MRIANLSGRLVLIRDGLAVDVERASDGTFAADPQAVYERWEEFRSWAGDAELPAGEPFEPTALGSPVPAPRQTLAIGLNYRDHAAESGFTVPEGLPPVFAKDRCSPTQGTSAHPRLPECPRRTRPVHASVAATVPWWRVEAPPAGRR